MLDIQIYSYFSLILGIYLCQTWPALQWEKETKWTE